MTERQQDTWSGLLLTALVVAMLLGAWLVLRLDDDLGGSHAGGPAPWGTAAAIHPRPAPPTRGALSPPHHTPTILDLR
jgi:hypothetical protein